MRKKTSSVFLFLTFTLKTLLFPEHFLGRNVIAFEIYITTKV
jgi:hypothetical protein